MPDKISIVEIDSSAATVYAVEDLPPLSQCHTEQYVVQAAQVVGSGPCRIEVQTRPMSQCKACVSLGGCRLSVFGRWGRPSASRLKIATERRFPVDSWLWIGLSRQGLLRSLVLLYFVPVLCLLVGGAVGCWFWPMLSGAAFVGQGPQWGVDAVTAVGMMLGLVLGVLLVRWQARAMHPLGITVLWPGESAEL